MITTNHVFLLEYTRHRVLFLKGKIFEYMPKSK